MEQESLIHNLPQSSSKKQLPPFVIPALVFLGVLLFGYMTGSMAAKAFKTKPGTATTATGDVTVVQEAGKKEGIMDKKAFPDTAEGTLQEGGIDGEGSFHLVRGAADQNAYLTSSVIDLSEYVGKNVVVYGTTFKGQKAGWLMDVGYVEVK